ncbi:MAG: glucosaminidase domain-containing protein [Bacteroidales bacterium]|nr:glucosaminidase domain-containing protein [Candidatus Sodaliphilus aphodohippi]
MCFFALFADAERLNDKFLAYIDQYKELAIEQQEQYGVPAAITLAQGLLESGAGQSYLARVGNNHFGVKSLNWSGPRVEFTDTTGRRTTSYRRYQSVKDSYTDHSKCLQASRYKALYLLDVNDYRGWAHGLKQCGYAEDPGYAGKLISIIEQYDLHLIAACAKVKNSSNSKAEKKLTASAKDEPSARSQFKKFRDKKDVPPAPERKQPEPLKTVPQPRSKKVQNKRDIPPRRPLGGSTDNDQD